MNENKDKAKLIASLEKERKQKKKEIEFIKTLDVNKPVTEKEWHKICDTSIAVANSPLLKRIVQATFPKAKNIQVYGNKIYFQLYHMDCYLPTVRGKYISIDTSWYKPISLAVPLCFEDSKFYREVEQWDKLLKNPNPSLREQIDAVYPSHNCISYHQRLCKYMRNYNEVKRCLDPEVMKAKVEHARIQYENERIKYRDLRMKMHYLTEDLNKALNYLNKFTEHVEPVRESGLGFQGYTPKEIIDMERKFTNDYLYKSMQIDYKEQDGKFELC